MKDPMFLAQKAKPATAEDAQVLVDLRDTLGANLDRCVGMAANMIGVCKAIIAVVVGGKIVIMQNPQIILKKGEYQTEEGCLSLSGVRPTKRYREISVTYQDESGRKRTERFTGFTAQIIQHEVDHLNGVLI